MLRRGMLQRVLIPQVEALIMHAVQDHVHAGEVVGGGVHLLPVEVAHVLDLLRHPQQQGAGAAGGVIDALQALASGSDDLRQNGTDLLRRVELPGLLPRTTGKLADEILIGISQHVRLDIGQAEVDLVQMHEHLGDEFVLLVLGLAELRRAEIKVLKQPLEVLLAVMPHGAGLDVLQDGGEVLQNKIVLLPRPFLRHAVKQLRRLQEVAQTLHRLFFDGLQHLFALGGLFIQLGKGDAVVFQDLIREEVNALGEVFVEDEAQDVVPELIRPHLPTQRVGDVPELGVEGLFCVVGHEERHESGGGWGRQGQTEPGAESVFGWGNGRAFGRFPG